MIAEGAPSYLPVYPLERTSRNGSGQFEIAQVSGLTAHQQELFFIPHYKAFYLLVFVQAGGSRHWVDGVPFTVKPDHLYFSSPHQLILKEEGTAEATALCFSQEFLDLEDTGLLNQLAIIQNPHNKHELHLSPADLLFVQDITEKLLAEQQQNHPLRSSMLAAYLRVLLLYLSRLYNDRFAAEAPSADRALLSRFRSLVNDHFIRHHDVAAYAGMLHLSTGHFSDRIKKQSGRTPIEHIHDRLLLEAKRLLFHTDVSVKEIAFELGFEEASYFNRFFKRLTESTPLDYRSGIREMYH